MYYVSRICHRRVCHLRHQKSQSPIQRPAWLLGCHLNQLLSNNRLVQVSPFGLPTASFRVDLSRYPQISPSSSLELRLVKSQSSWWQNGPFGMWYVRSGTLHFAQQPKLSLLTFEIETCFLDFMRGSLGLCRHHHCIDCCYCTKVLAFKQVIFMICFADRCKPHKTQQSSVGMRYQRETW